MACWEGVSDCRGIIKELDEAQHIEEQLGKSVLIRSCVGACVSQHLSSDGAQVAVDHAVRLVLWCQPDHITCSVHLGLPQ